MMAYYGQIMVILWSHCGHVMEYFKVIYYYGHTYIHTLHCIALHCISLHYITLHCIALHCIALHYITLHYLHTLHTYIIYIYMNRCQDSSEVLKILTGKALGSSESLRHVFDWTFAAIIRITGYIINNLGVS